LLDILNEVSIESQVLWEDGPQHCSF